MPTLAYPVRIEKLEAHERPKHWFEYFVVGRGPFPYDMLRHDLCWPATSVDAAYLEPDERAKRAVKINSYREPRIGRWESFGWKVSDNGRLPDDYLDALGDENAKGETPLPD